MYVRRYVDSLIVLLEALDSLNLEKDSNYTAPSFGEIIRATPWPYGEKLFKAILDVCVSSPVC